MFLLSRRWVGLALFVAILATVCIRLGFWQYHRLEERLASNEITQTHLQADPVPLSETLAPDQDVTDDDEWMRVTAEGRYDTAHQVTVRYKTRDGQPGVNVVTPLITESGDAILIDRGWMQTNNRGEKPDRVPAPPTGTVTVTGWLRPDSQADDQAVTPHGGQVRAIASGGITSHVPYDLYHGYISLRDSNPKPHTSLVAESKPDLGQGPHLFYAIQWWFFAALAVFGFGYFAYSEARDRKAPAPQAKSTSSA